MVKDCEKPKIKKKSKYDIKLFTKNETQTQAVRIYNQDKGMEFLTENYVMLIMSCGKREMIERIEIRNQGKIRTLGEKESYKYSGSGHQSNTITRKLLEINYTNEISSKR